MASEANAICDDVTLPIVPFNAAVESLRPSSWVATSEKGVQCYAKSCGDDIGNYREASKLVRARRTIPPMMTIGLSLCSSHLIERDIRQNLCRQVSNYGTIGKREICRSCTL